MRLTSSTRCETSRVPWPARVRAGGYPHVETKRSPVDIVSQFQIEGRLKTAAPYGTGHINDTFCAVFDRDGNPANYILQRINHNIFRNPPAVMDNIVRVTRHLHAKLADVPDRERRAMTVIPTRDGNPYFRDDAGDYWRCYVFVGGASTYDIIETPRQAFEAARAFGRFQETLSDLPLPPLHETIPDFHHTPKRFAALVQAIEKDASNRAAQAKAEIAFALRRESMTGVLINLQKAGRMPVRTTHNDTKLNNVMLDDKTGEGICVIDLDTVMPGLALNDFGDMVRSATNSGAEDEKDLSRIRVRMDVFEALARGYLDTAGSFLVPDEKSHMAFSGKLITFEIGIRFLADFLNGDVYFKTKRPEHNLDRCRTQFKLVKDIEDQEDRMAAFVASLA